MTDRDTLRNLAKPWAYNPGLLAFLTRAFPALVVEAEAFPWHRVPVGLARARRGEREWNCRPHLTAALVSASAASLVSVGPPLPPGLDRLRRNAHLILGRKWRELSAALECKSPAFPDGALRELALVGA
jgi:hypothetical protein